MRLHVPVHHCVYSYLLSRNGAAASTITEQARKLNPESQVVFIKADTSLIKNVDAACKDIQSREDKINFLFMTTGYLTFDGRNGAPRHAGLLLQLN